MKKKTKIPYNKAMDIARRFLKLIEPHVVKMEIAGQLRRQCKEISHIEIVCVPTPSLNELFHDEYPGLEINGKRLKRFKYPKDKVQIELHLTPSYDYGRMLAIKTGSSAFMHIKLSVQWNRKGWSATEQGLRRKSECHKTKTGKWVLKEEYRSNPTMPEIFDTEWAFFNFLGIDYILPQDRNWVAKNNKLNYSH